MLTDKKAFLTLLIFILATAVFFLPGNAGAAAEEVLFQVSNEPDAMILFDISASMEWNPAGGTNKYGASNSCTADTTICGTGARYAASNCDTPDTTNCVSTGTRYAASSTCASDTTNCANTATRYGSSSCTTTAACANTRYAHSSSCASSTSSCTGTGCSGGYCSSSKTNCTYSCPLTGCSGGFCASSQTGCSTNCTVSDCSGGYCSSSHSGCSNSCTATCSAGYCNAATSTCALNCTAAGSCSGGFCSSSGGGCTTDCSRLSIAKRAIASMLDYDNNDTINSADHTSLQVRMGLTTFKDVVTNVKPLNTDYQSIFCGDATSCSTTATSCTSGNCVVNVTTAAATALVSALANAKTTLDADTSSSCREKFVILLSDGADNQSCSGAGADGIASTRRAAVAGAKALRDAGYKLFVIGFGAGMPDNLQNALNWMAYYGGTSDPDATQTGSTSGYSIPSGSVYPTGITSSNNCSASTSVDPGNAALSGYAFIAGDSDSLADSLRRTISVIRQAFYSYSATSLSSARITSENNIYEASLQSIDNEPFWLGRLNKYNIGSDGSVGAAAWEAGAVLAETSESSRSIYTYKSGALTAFNTTNITAADLGVGTDTRRNEIVGYFRGNTTYNPETDNWKLGDIWHSNPVVITSPSPYFVDKIDTGTTNAFSSYRTAHQRTSANGYRVVVVGANDGQFHIFKTSDGTEAFSFIPPNLLPKLTLVAHTSHPTSLTHQYFVDGPVSAAEVWLPSTLGTGASKSSSDWETLVVFGEGRGAGSYLWSSSSSCDSGFNATYSATYQYYCGYYALDLTNTLSPAYKWRINPSATDAPYLNLPWSKMAIGRVKISGNERWVGFVGGGGYEYTCSGTPTEPTNAGKGFFVVDLTNGNVLWSFKNGATNTSTTSTSMTYSIAAPPSIVDTDNDGFIDTAYVGDLGGNIWRFSFCPNSMTTCNTSNWSGGKFYNQTLTARPIYTGAALATDASNNLWVNWGSGDKQCPALSTVSEKFYALKDPPAGTCTTTAGCNIGASGFTCTTGRCTKTYSGSDLFDATSATFSSSSTQQGWYVSMGSGGEKILAEPSLFGGKVYFTSFTPGTDICTQGGTGKLYGLNYTTAAGALGTTASPVKSINLGTGIPSAAIISMKPDGTGADMYVTNSGGAGTNAQTTQVPNANLGFPSSRTNILYWKDRRVQ